MSDYGDFCREQRAHRQALRMYWHECPHCAIRFGTGTKVEPGGRCRHDGWQAPGESGDDERAASEINELRQATRERKAKRKRAQSPCRFCGKRFRTEQGRADHERDVHADESATSGA